MDKNTDEALKKAKAEEEKEIPSIKEIEDEDKEFKKEEKKAFGILSEK